MQRQSSSLLWWMIVLLTAISIAVSSYLFLKQKTEPSALNDASQQTQLFKTDVNPASTPKLDVPKFQATPNQVLIEEELLSEAIPEDASLAQEEIAKQLDLQQQLIAQEEALQQQHLTADELIRLKEQQIKLLEQLLAE